MTPETLENHDWFCGRRLCTLLSEQLAPLSFRFVSWGVRSEGNSPVYEYTFITPDGRKEITTGISQYEIFWAGHSLDKIAKSLSARMVKKVQDERREH